MSTVSPAEGGHDSNPYVRNLELLPFPEFEEGYLPSNVSVHFHFTPHRTAEQFEEASTLLADSDIFAVENAGWSARSLRDTRAVSKGDWDMLNSLKQGHSGYVNSEFNNAILDGIYRTYKPIIFIDADETQREMVIGDTPKLYIRSVGKEVDTTLDGFADVLAVIAEGAYKRDLVIANTLGPLITNEVASRPKLFKKERVNVLYLLGFAHRHAYNAFADDPVTSSQVSESTWANLRDIDPESILVKRYKEGGSPTREEMEELMVAQALSMASIPQIANRTLYDFNVHYKRTPDTFDLASRVMLDSVIAMGPNGLSLCHRILTKSIKKEDSAALIEVVKEAIAQVAS